MLHLKTISLFAIVWAIAVPIKVSFAQDHGGCIDVNGVAEPCVFRLDGGYKQSIESIRKGLAHALTKRFPFVQEVNKHNKPLGNWIPDPANLGRTRPYEILISTELNDSIGQANDAVTLGKVAISLGGKNGTQGLTYVVGMSAIYDDGNIPSWSITTARDSEVVEWVDRVSDAGAPAPPEWKTANYIWKKGDPFAHSVNEQQWIIGPDYKFMGFETTADEVTLSVGRYFLRLKHCADSVKKGTDVLKYCFGREDTSQWVIGATAILMGEAVRFYPIQNAFGKAFTDLDKTVREAKEQKNGPALWNDNGPVGWLDAMFSVVMTAELKKSINYNDWKTGLKEKNRPPVPNMWTLIAGYKTISEEPGAYCNDGTSQIIGLRFNGPVVPMFDGLHCTACSTFGVQGCPTFKDFQKHK